MRTPTWRPLANPLQVERGLHVGVLIKEGGRRHRQRHRDVAVAVHELPSADHARGAAAAVVELRDAVSAEPAVEVPAQKKNSDGGGNRYPRQHEEPPWERRNRGSSEQVRNLLAGV